MILMVGSGRWEMDLSRQWGFTGMHVDRVIGLQRQLLG